MIYALLTLNQYIHARDAIKPTRGWYGHPETGTTDYCGDQIQDVHGTYPFPLVDASAEAFIATLYPLAQLSQTADFPQSPDEA